MRNRFKNSTSHIYETPTPNVTLTVDTVGSTYQYTTLILYGANGSNIEITDSYGVKTIHTIVTNGNITVNVDAHAINSELLISSDQMTRFRINYSNNRSAIRKMQIHKEGGLTSLEQMAYGNVQLTEFISVDLPNVTNANFAFRETVITSFPDIDVSGMTSVSGMFYGCSDLTAINANFTGVTVTASSFAYNCTKLKCLAGITTYSTTDTTSGGMFSSPVLVTPTAYEKDQIINNPNGYVYVKPAYLTNCSFGLFEIDLVKYDTTNNLKIRVYGLTSDISCTIVDTTGTSTTHTTTATSLTISNIDVSGASNTIKVTMPNIKNFRIISKYVKEAHILNEGTLISLDNFNGNYGSFLDTFTSVSLNYVDTVSHMFWYNTSLTTIPTLDLPFCRSYNNFLKGSGITSFPSNWLFDVANNLTGLFYNCLSLTSLSQLDFPRGKTINDAFRNCNNLTTLSGVTFSQISGDVVTLKNTWYDCASLTVFPSIDLSKVTELYNTWYNCSSLTSFPVLDTSTITTASYTWRYCTSLLSFPTLNFSNLTYGLGIWSKCTSLTSFPTIHFPSIATSFRDIWNECSSLTTFPLINITCSGAGNLSKNWYKCSSLVSFPNINLSTATNLDSAWSYCSNMTSWNVTNISNSVVAGSMFAYCTVLDNVTVDLSNSTQVSYLFKSCTNLTLFEDSTGSGTFDISSATSIGQLLDSCSSIVQTPVLDITSATAAYSLFSNCTSLQYIKGLGTSGNVGSMTSMFNNCNSLICMDAMDGTSSIVSNNPINVFSNCTSLIAPNSAEQIDIVDNNVNWTNSNTCP